MNKITREDISNILNSLETHAKLANKEKSQKKSPQKKRECLKNNIVQKTYTNHHGKSVKVMFVIDGNLYKKLHRRLSKKLEDAQKEYKKQVAKNASLQQPRMTDVPGTTPSPNPRFPQILARMKRLIIEAAK